MTHPPVMSLRGITHSFGAVRALIDRAAVLDENERLVEKEIARISRGGE